MKNRYLNVIILFILTIQTTSFSYAQCSITELLASRGSCDPSTNLFQLSGTVTFVNQPTTGYLTITDCQGDADTLYPPFTSPSNFSFQANSTGTQNCTITAVFSADTNCVISLNTLNYPGTCLCNADVGTFNANILGQSTTNYSLCYGDVIEITSNGDMIPPYEAISPPISSPYGYRPGIGYLMYSCPPTIFPPGDINSDPCQLGVLSFGNNYDAINNFGVGAPFTNSTVFFVPITFYDTVELIYSYTNVGSNCYSMGNPIAVQFLPEVIDSNAQENNIDSTFSVEIYGGLPQLNGSLFSAYNLIPATAYFINNTTNHGGLITIGGLLDGDVYSFSVSDSTGCELIISGGPYVGLPVGTSEMIANSDFTIYPNPTKDELTIEFLNTKENNLTLEIYTILGKKVLQKHVEISSSTSIFHLNLENEANGVYFLKIISKNSSLTKQVLKN